MTGAPDYGPGDWVIVIDQGAWPGPKYLKIGQKHPVKAILKPGDMGPDGYLRTSFGVLIYGLMDTVPEVPNAVGWATECFRKFDPLTDCKRVETKTDKPVKVS